MIKDILLWEKYRPKELSELILPKRVSDIVSKGVITNMLFVGPPGIGKTTCARVLAETGGHPYMEISAGADTNAVEQLREKVERFVGQYDLITAEADQHKVVILDEFERASKTYQVALQSFIERHSDKVRFILCANTSMLLNDAMKSRFKELQFDYLAQDEKKQAKIRLAARLSQIAEKEGYDQSYIIAKRDGKKQIPKPLIAHVNRYFPDFRRAVEELQFSQVEIDSTPEASAEELYQLIMSDASPDAIWDFIFSSYDINYDAGFRALGRPFFGTDGYFKQRRGDKYNAVLVLLSRKYREYMAEWATSPDPLILLLTLAYDYQEIIKNAS